MASHSGTGLVGRALRGGLSHQQLDISYLGDLKFENGSPLYNERELTHMADVKNVVRGALNVWYISLAILALLAMLAWRGDWVYEFINGLRRGGMWMIGLAVSLD